MNEDYKAHIESQERSPEQYSLIIQEQSCCYQKENSRTDHDGTISDDLIHLIRVKDLIQCVWNKEQANYN